MLIIIIISILIVLLNIYLGKQYKNNKIERAKLSISLLKDSLLIILIYIGITNKNLILSNTNKIIDKVENISQEQQQLNSIANKIQDVIKELNNKNIVFVEDILNKINEVNSNLDSVNKQMESNIKRQQIITDKIEDVKQKIENMQTISESEGPGKTKIIWVGQ